MRLDHAPSVLLKVDIYMTESSDMYLLAILCWRQAIVDSVSFNADTARERRDAFEFLDAWINEDPRKEVLVRVAQQRYLKGGCDVQE